MRVVIDYEAVLKDVVYKDWRFRVGGDGSDRWLQATFESQDPRLPGTTIEHSGRKWRLSPWMTRSEVIRTALAAVLTAEEHEARERFQYLGRAVFGPHIDVDALWHACEDLDARAVVVDDGSYASAMALASRGQAIYADAQRARLEPSHEMGG